MATFVLIGATNAMPQRQITAGIPQFLISAFPIELIELAAILDGRRAILDGEVVALEPGDRPSLARLRQRMLLRTFMILNVAPSKATGSSGLAVRDRRG